MEIVNGKVVTLNYTLKDDDGNVIDHSDDGSFVYLHGASNIIPGLEDALAGKIKDTELNVSVAPENGYGKRDDARRQQVPKDMFPEDTKFEEGMQFNAQGPEDEMVVVTITEIGDTSVTVDGNHPLAGIQLNFDVKIIDVRDASEEEVSHGHVHGAGGHQH